MSWKRTIMPLVNERKTLELASTVMAEAIGMPLSAVK